MDADAWFFDLGKMAERIEYNTLRADRLRKRQWVAIAFFFFAFMLVSYRTELQQQRSEVSGHRIQVNTEKIKTIQDEFCAANILNVVKFNHLQDSLIAVERKNTRISPLIRQARIDAYEDAKILPLPVCLK